MVVFVINLVGMSFRVVDVVVHHNNSSSLLLALCAPCRFSTLPHHSATCWGGVVELVMDVVEGSGRIGGVVEPISADAARGPDAVHEQVGMAHLCTGSWLCLLYFLEGTLYQGKHRPKKLIFLFRMILCCNFLCVKNDVSRVCGDTNWTARRFRVIGYAGI